MTIAAASRPSALPAAPLAVIVPSDSRLGTSHRVTRDACSCEAFTFNHPRNPAYRCKHMIRWFAPVPQRAAPRLCEHCRIDVARQASCFCSERCRQASIRAACRHDWEDAGSCEFGCPKCGATYSYDRDEPLMLSQTRPNFYDARVCPGYLREHAATPEHVATYWCDACTPADCR